MALGVTLVLLPIPGVLARVTHRIQTEKMKRTDERVEMVTESASWTSSSLFLVLYLTPGPFLSLATKVIRMVKLFGWEARMSERIAEKREEELKWIKRLQYVHVLVEVVK